MTGLCKSSWLVTSVPQPVLFPSDQSEYWIERRGASILQWAQWASMVAGCMFIYNTGYTWDLALKLGWVSRVRVSRSRVGWTYEGVFGVGMGVLWGRYVKHCRCCIAKDTGSKSFISSCVIWWDKHQLLTNRGFDCNPVTWKGYLGQAEDKLAERVSYLIESTLSS